MKTPKRALASMVAFAAAVALTPAIASSPASALGVSQGAAVLRTAGGAADLYSAAGSAAFTLRLPAGAACTGDSANDNYRVQSYVVPASVDPATLTFDAAGPLPAGTGAAFSQPLYGLDTTPFVDVQTAAATVPGGPGPIVNIPDFNYQVFSNGHIAPGDYNVGIACTLGGPGPDQLKEFWNTTKTFVSDPSGGSAQVRWQHGDVAPAPTITSAAGGDGVIEVAFAGGAAVPAVSGYTATATPVGGGAAVTATGTDSPIVISGLANEQDYTVTVRATNVHGDSPESSPEVVRVTARGPVRNLAWFADGPGTATLTWDAPLGAAPDGYRVEVSPADAGPFTLPAGTTSHSVSGLTPGESYTITVIPTHGGDDGPSQSVTPVTVNGDSVIIQEITVTRPVGALVLTQVCGANGLIPAETAATTGFPALPEVPAVTAGVAPTLTLGGSDQDPLFDQYPYPENPDGTPAANYPTHCGVDLGVAKLVKSGPGAGQFFAASGVMNQVTVVDTRDTDTGWVANGTMSAFEAGPGKTFSGSQLGWTPQVTSDSEAFTDSDGNTYDQAVDAGSVVAPNTANASGLGSGRALGTAGAGEGLGIATFDARLKLLIPITARSGDYTGTLTISAI